MRTRQRRIDDSPTIRLGLVLATLALSAGADCENGIGLRLPDPNVRVIAFGDSTTAGPGAMQYVDFLPDLLNEPANAFANEGRGGETTVEGVVRLESLLAARLFPNADTLVYWQGGNDLIDFIQDHDPLIALSPDDAIYPFTDDLRVLLDGIAQNLRAAVDAGNAAGLSVVIVTYYFIPEQIIECRATPLDLIFPGQAVVANAYTTRLNQVIRDAAAASGAMIVDIADLDAVLRGNIGNYENCNYLSADGNQIAAQRIAQAL